MLVAEREGGRPCKGDDVAEPMGEPASIKKWDGEFALARTKFTILKGAILSIEFVQETFQMLKNYIPLIDFFLFFESQNPV